jgi:hypothetical protein
LIQDLGRYERIAVAITADPAADAEERVDLQTAPLRIESLEPVFELGIEARQLA